MEFSYKIGRSYQPEGQAVVANPIAVNCLYHKLCLKTHDPGNGEKGGRERPARAIRNR